MSNGTTRKGKAFSKVLSVVLCAAILFGVYAGFFAGFGAMAASSSTTIIDMAGVDVTDLYLSGSMERADNGNVELSWVRTPDPTVVNTASDSVVSKRVYNNSEKDRSWNWDQVKVLRSRLDSDAQVWDGSNSLTHNFTKYIDNNQVSALNGVLYDSATWQYHLPSGYQDRQTEELRLFEGSFKASGINRNLYTLHSVVGDEILINDNIYVFVYPTQIRELINNNESSPYYFMNYLSFWAGTYTLDQYGIKYFNGKTAAAITNGSQDVSVLYDLVDWWYTPAFSDNIGETLRYGYSQLEGVDENSTVDFTLDVVTSDIVEGGGLYRLAIDETPIFDIKKVDEKNNDKLLAGAQFTLYTDSACKNVFDKSVNVGDGTYYFSKISAMAGTNVPNMTYYMKETVAPEGYLLDNRVYVLSLANRCRSAELYNVDGSAVKRDAFDYYTITNSAYDLEITKVDEETNKPLTGARFDVTAVNGANQSSIDYSNFSLAYALRMDGADKTGSSLYKEGIAANNAAESYSENLSGIVNIRAVTGTETSGSGQTKAMLFDNTAKTKAYFSSKAPIEVAFSMYDDEATIVNKYSITTAGDATKYPDRNPKAWKLQARNSSTDSWITLDSRSDQSFSSNNQVKTYSFTNETAFKQYRLYITELKGGKNFAQCQLADLTLYGVRSGISLGGSKIADAIFFRDADKGDDCLTVPIPFECDRFDFTVGIPDKLVASGYSGGTQNVTVYADAARTKAIGSYTLDANNSVIENTIDTTGLKYVYVVKTGGNSGCDLAYAGHFYNEATDADGTLHITGIMVGSYIITETAAPAGYHMLTSPVAITVGSDGSVSCTGNAGGHVKNVRIDGKTIKVTVSNDIILPGSVTVKYVDTEGNELLPSVYDRRESPDGTEKYSYPEVPIENYRTVKALCEGSPDGVFEEDTDKTIVYVYEKIPAPITIYYVNEDGYEIAEHQSMSAFVGDSLAEKNIDANFKKDEIGIYSYKSTDVNVTSDTITEDGVVITYVYKYTPDSTEPEVIKTSNPASGETVAVGDVITYSVKVTNHKAYAMENFQITDAIPVGSAYVDGSASNGGELFGSQLVWNVSSIAPEESVTVTFQVTVTGSELTNNLHNQAFCVYTELEADEPTSYPSTVTDHALLTVSKEHSAVEGNGRGVGETFYYTVTVTNIGSAAANGITVTDVLPYGINYVSGADSYDETTRAAVWTVDLAPGESLPLVLTVTAGTLPEGVYSTTIDNRAVVTDGDKPLDESNVVTDRIENGKVTINYILTDGTVLSESKTSSGKPGSSYGDYGPIGIDRYEYTNRSDVAVNGEDTSYDSLSGKYVVGEIVINHIYRLKNDPALPDVVKVADPEENSTVAAGDTITYTISVVNNKSYSMTDVAVVDAIPAGTEFLSSEYGDAVDGIFSATIDSIPAGESRAVSFKVKVLEPESKGLLSNKAQAEYVELYADQPTSVDSNTVRHSILGITKESSVPADTILDKGESFTYTVSVTNYGEAAAAEVIISDDLPKGLTFVGCSAADGSYAVENGKLIINVGAIAAGEKRSFDITVSVDDFDYGTEKFVNIATAASISGDKLVGTVTSDPVENNASRGKVIAKYVDQDGNVLADEETFTGKTGEPFSTEEKVIQSYELIEIPENPAGTFTDGVIELVYVYRPAADLSEPSREKTAVPADGSTVKAGDTITYTITVTNNKSYEMTDVTVTDAIPAGTEFVASEDGKCTDGVFTAVIASIPKDGSKSVSFSVTVKNPAGNGLLSNQANITYTDMYATEPNTVVTNKVDHAILSVVKTSVVSEDKSTVTYSITVTNNGSADANNVIVRDALSEYVTFNSSDLGVCTDGVVTAQIEKLAAGESKTINIVTDVVPFEAGKVTIKNTAVVQYDKTPDASDPDTDEITSNEVIDEISRGTVVAKYVDQQGNSLAEQVTSSGITGDEYTTEPKDVPGYELIEVPANAQGVYTDGEQEVVYVYKLRPDSALPEVIKTADPADGSAVKTGDIITYTISVTNKKFYAMTDVKVVDAIPNGAAFVLSSDGQLDENGDFTATIDSIASGETKSVSFVCHVVAPADIEEASLQNTAKVEYTDIEATEPTVVESNTVKHAQVSIAKTSDIPQINVLKPGDSLTYTLTVKNSGSADAENVVVTDKLPAGTSFVEASEGECTENGVFTAELGTLASGAEKAINVTVSVDSLSRSVYSADIVNKANVSFDKTPGGEDRNTATSDEVTNIVRVGEYIARYVDTEGNVLADPIGGDGRVGDHYTTNVLDIPGYTFVSATDNTAGTITLGVTEVIYTYTKTPAAVNVKYIDKATGEPVAPSVFDDSFFIGNEIPAKYAKQTDVVGYTFDSVTKPDDMVFNNSVEEIIHYYNRIPQDDAPEFVKSSNPESGSLVKPGNKIEYTLTVTNPRTLDAIENAVVTDAIPAGTTYVKNSASNGGKLNDDGVLVWNLGKIDPEKTITLKFAVTVDSGLTDTDNIFNVANVTYDDGVTIPSNSTVHALLTASLTSSIPEEDVLSEGNQIIYTVTVKNIGTAPAVDTDVRALIPEGTTFAYAITEGATENPESVDWVIDNIEPGETVELKYVVSVDKLAEETFNIDLPNGAFVNDDPTNDVLNKAAAGKIIIRYVDKAGNELANQVEIEGVVGDLITLPAERSFTGMFLDDFSASDQSATYVDGTITYTYTYDKTPVETPVETPVQTPVQTVSTPAPAVTTPVETVRNTKVLGDNDLYTDSFTQVKGDVQATPVTGDSSNTFAISALIASTALFVIVITKRRTGAAV